MRHDEDGDIIPEELARRRGMVYHKDSRGHVCEAHQPNPFLIDVLLHRKIISHEHHFHGVQMIAMRKAFLNPVAYKFGMLSARREDDSASAPALPIRDTDYLKVLRGMRNNRWKEIVMEVCEEHSDPVRANNLEKISGSVQMAFDQLCDAVQALWEHKKTCREKCGEECRGVCR